MRTIAAATGLSCISQSVYYMGISYCGVGAAFLEKGLLMCFGYSMIYEGHDAMIGGFPYQEARWCRSNTGVGPHIITS